MATTYQERLRSAMKDAGIETSRLAAEIGVTYQAIKKVLDSGTNALSAPNNAKAAKALGVRSDWLATGLGPRAPISARALRIAELIDELGPPDSPAYNEAVLAMRDALDAYTSSGPHPAEAPRIRTTDHPARLRAVLAERAPRDPVMVNFDKRGQTGGKKNGPPRKP